MKRVVRHRLVPVVWTPDMIFYASCGPQAEAFANHQNLKVVAHLKNADFLWAVRKVWGRKILRNATFGLFNASPEFSARHRILPAQALVMFMGLIAIATSMLQLPVSVTWAAANAIVGLFFLSVVALRLFCIMPGNKIKSPPPLPLGNEQLPLYSVLVPVFRETAVLKQLLQALSKLDYPKEKLDIKIIVEENDTGMRRMLENFRLPRHFEIIVVPQGKPQTKPRALNYALQFSRGELLTIFDAEDIPEPDQLRLAAQKFAVSSSRLACLQARLIFFNATENWLTRQFTAEYATLFGLILPALSNANLPLLLGGTSNHFRIRALRAVGAWDPHNVTEDADLGLRLVREGYHTCVLDSLTTEEANTQFVNWLKQRARWLKGFMQTWLVHMRNPLLLKKEIGLPGFWVMQSCTAGIFLSALFHPPLFGFAIWQFVQHPFLEPGAPLLASILGGLNLAVFLVGYGVAILAARKALHLRGLKGWRVTLATMPIYWLMMSLAAWLALWQFVFSPFKWNKTKHGLSKF
jgi:cellulose synthase/poly-beta-1,6-N-acetylglucosamine synthase-like glycosyltransferase